MLAMGGPTAPPAVRLPLDPANDTPELARNLLASFRAHSYVKVRTRLPTTSTRIYSEMTRVFNQPMGVKEAMMMPEECQTGIRGGPEYCNAGYLGLPGDKEYMSLRRSATGAALPAPPTASASAAVWRASQFAEVGATSISELEVLGKRVLGRIEAALVEEAGGTPTAPGNNGFLASKLDYASASESKHLEPRREAETSNSTISMLRYHRNDARDAVAKTLPEDSGEVNAGVQLPGTGLPCAAHTDASILTLITAPSQLGLEIFDVTHPMERSAHAAALAGHAAGQQPDGLAAAGGEAMGLWVPGFAEDELTRGVKDEPLPYSDHESRELGTDEGWCEVLVMGGDMLVYASGGVLPATRHRVTPTWDRDASVRFSLISGLYGADTAQLEPGKFREMCGLESWPDCPPPMNAKDSRTSKLYLDYDARAEKAEAPTPKL